MGCTRWEQMMHRRHDILVVTWPFAGRWAHLLLSTSPGLSKFWTSWGQVIRAQVPTTNGSSQRVGALALSDPKYSFECGGQQHSS